MKENHGLKKYNNLDVTIRSYNEAEVCELIAIFMLSLVGNKYNPNGTRLYRNDGLQFKKKKMTRNLKKLKRLFKKF